MRTHRVLISAAFAALVLGVVAPSALAGSGPTVTPGAEYRGKATALQIAESGTEVEISKLPVKQQCDGEAPTNLGDFGDPGLGPFSIKANGTFTNGGAGGDFLVKGRFKGTTVKGTVKAAAFEDKGFDCKAYRGKWSAKLVDE